jgi:purine-binding chemotaxis protein CheW
VTAVAAPLSDATDSVPSAHVVAEIEAAPAAVPSEETGGQGETHVNGEAPEIVSPEPPPTDAASGIPDARIEEFLGFRLDAEEYCLWIRSVREIIRPTEITPIPRSPVDIMGIISLRGSIVPVFDVRRRLALPPRETDQKSRIVVVMVDGTPVGLVVDYVTEVINAEPGALGPPPTTMGEREAGFVTATLRHRERLIGVLHLERLVAVEAVVPRAAA